LRLRKSFSECLNDFLGCGIDFPGCENDFRGCRNGFRAVLNDFFGAANVTGRCFRLEIAESGAAADSEKGSGSV
jgi:hypothetical protein